MVISGYNIPPPVKRAFIYAKFIFSVLVVPLMLWIYFTIAGGNPLDRYRVSQCRVTEVKEVHPTPEENLRLEMTVHESGGGEQPFSFTLSEDECEAELGRSLWAENSTHVCYRSLNDGSLMIGEGGPFTLQAVFTMGVMISIIIALGGWKILCIKLMHMESNVSPEETKILTLKYAQYATLIAVLSIVTIVTTTFGFRDFSEIKSKSWVLSQCRIEMVCPPGKGSQLPKVTYTYAVDSTTYVSDAILPFEASLSNTNKESGGLDTGVLDSLKPGNVVPCYENPDAPYQRKLTLYDEPKVSRYLWTFGIAGVVLLILEPYLRRREIRKLRKGR